MSAVASHLQAHSIPHRFVLAGKRQQLILLRAEDVSLVQQLIERWQAGDLGKIEQGAPPKSTLRFNQKPATLSLLIIFLGFTGAALAGFGQQFIHLFTFWDPLKLPYLSFIEPSPWGDIQNGQLWRLITPIFLHFGPVHIIFNALWIWYLGSIIENHQGKIRLLLLVLVIGVASNSAQAMVSEGIIFGGLSGVVHGLFGYCWLWGKLNRQSAVQIPDTLFVVITLLMLLSPLGIFDIIAGAEIADTAHISGYVAGLACALALHVLNAFFRETKP